MKVGDLIRGKDEWNNTLGVILSVKEKEYCWVKWLDNGEEVCYHYEDHNDQVPEYLEVISESR